MPFSFDHLGPHGFVIAAASKKVTSTVNVSGAGMLLGIDLRPADGMLYGVTSDGNIVTIDVASGKATMKSKLSEPWARSAATTFDINPVADREPNNASFA